MIALLVTTWLISELASSIVLAAPSTEICWSTEPIFMFKSAVTSAPIWRITFLISAVSKPGATALIE